MKCTSHVDQGTHENVLFKQQGLIPAKKGGPRKLTEYFQDEKWFPSRHSTEEKHSPDIQNAKPCLLSICVVA